MRQSNRLLAPPFCSSEETEGDVGGCMVCGEPDWTPDGAEKVVQALLDVGVRLIDAESLGQAFRDAYAPRRCDLQGAARWTAWGGAILAALDGWADA